MQLPGGIDLTDIRLRIARLTRLALGFGRERLFWPKDNDGLHFNEREPYLEAIGEAESACEKARVVLAKAEHRLKEAEKARSSGSHQADRAKRQTKKRAAENIVPASPTTRRRRWDVDPRCRRQEERRP